jgi:hypothetical protein
MELVYGNGVFGTCVHGEAAPGGWRQFPLAGPTVLAADAPYEGFSQHVASA